MKKWTKNPGLLLVCMLLIFLGVGCEKSSLWIQQAERLVWSQPDSALLLLSRIETPYLLEGKGKADYWRVRSRAHYATGRAMNNDSLILYALDYYRHRKDTMNLKENYLLAGEYYTWKREPDSAVYLFNKGFELASSIGDTAYSSWFLYRAGDVTFNQNKFKESAAYFKKEILLNTNHHFSYYMVALTEKGDSMDYLINQAVNLALEQGDTLQAAHYLRNYAQQLYVEKEYAKAMELIRRTGELSVYYKNFIMNHVLMSQIFIQTGQPDSAQYYLDKARNALGTTSLGIDKEKHGLEIFAEVNDFNLLQTVIDIQQHKELDLHRTGRFNDSIIREIYRNEKILVQQMNDRHTLEQQNLKLFINKQRLQLIFITGFALVIISGIGIYLYILNRKRKLEEIEERAASLQKLFKEALNVKDEKLHNTQLFKKTLLQQLGIIRLVATTPTHQNKELLPQIINISNESVSTESLLNWDDLYAIINSVYADFYEYLKKNYGEVLNEKEMQLCCLLCAGFSTVEMSAIMQQSMQTIYQRKSIIRTKLKMGDKQDIIEFLQEQFALQK